MKKESLLFSIFLFVSMLLVSSFAIGVTYFSLQNELPALYKSVLSRSWTKTEGKITKTYTSTKFVTAGSSKNPRSAVVYLPNVNYSFQIGSDTFAGKRIDFSGEEKYFPLQAESEEYLNSFYQINKSVEVFYNPHNPQESTLSQAYVYDSSSYQAGCGCGSLGILFSLLCWLSLRDLIKDVRTRKNRE